MSVSLPPFTTVRPALCTAPAARRRSINAQLQGYNRCMEDLGQRLDSMEEEGVFSGRGARPLGTVVYDTLALQARACCH